MQPGRRHTRPWFETPAPHHEDERVKISLPRHQIAWASVSPVRTRAALARNPSPLWERRQRMREEEAQHLARGVRAARIGVGAGGAAARPGVPGAMDLPVLEDGAPA